jgi:hypothetical protein
MIKPAMKTYAFAIALLASGSAANADEILCSAAPSTNRNHWSWYIVEGRPCWVAGHRIPKKSELHWELGGPPQEITAIDTFDDRWNALFNHDPVKEWEPWK